MPAQFTIPPDTRAVGTGNPPADMNNVSDALTASGTTFNVLNAAFSGGADPTGAADSTLAFRAAINAAVAVAGEVIIPPGAYNLNTANIPITGPFRMRGLGAGVANQGGGTLAPLPAVVLNSNGNGGSAPLFTFPFQGYLWGGLEMSGFAVTYTGTGNVLHLCNFTDALFRDMTTTLTAGSSMAIFTTGSVSYLNVLHERCNFLTTATVRSNPVISISSSIPASVSNNTFFKCKWTNNGYDTTQYQVVFSCTNSYHYADNMRECWFERPFGGAYQCLSGQNIIVDGCSVWDIFTGPVTTVAAGSNGGTISAVASWGVPFGGNGVLQVASTAGAPAAGTLNVAASGPTTAVVTYTGLTPTSYTGCAYVSGSPAGTVATGGSVNVVLAPGNSTFYFGAAPANLGTQGVQVSNCGRSQGGPNGSSTWDVFCESTTSNVVVSSFVNKSAAPTVYTPVYLNFSNCNDVVLLNNQSPQGSSVNGNSNTVVTNPSPTQALISQGLSAPLPDGSFQPADAAFLSWNYDPIRIGGNNAPTSGTVLAVRLDVRRPMTVTNVVLYQGAAGTGLVTGNLAGLYTSAGVQVGVSADQAAVWNSGTAVFKSAALAGGPFLIQPGLYFVLALSNMSAGGTPQWGFDRNFSVTTANANIGAGGARFAAGAAGVTTLPGSFTPSTYLTRTQLCYWVGLS